MEQRMIFRELLSEFKEKADLQGGRVTRGEVEDFFAHADLKKDQIDMICDYLVSQFIRVDGYESKETALQDKTAKTDGTGNDQVTEEDHFSESLKIYLEEIGGVRMPEGEELRLLFDAAADGDLDAADQLVCLFLPSVAAMAAEYDGDAITPEDLIGEGNVELMLAVRELGHQESLAAYQALLLNRLSENMQEVIRQHTRIDDSSRSAVGKVRHLHDAIRKLTQELEHPVSIEELSAYLEVPGEEITALLNLTGGEEDAGISSAPPKKPWEI